jgi:MinD-like ATPase involved in chromosome partitioning or flagellar assembly/Flp pilus assembly protein TadD
VTPPVTTFYSFKGGVGRTQAVANVGARLARMGFRVLLVDFDLEAPGLTWLVAPETPGVVDLFTDAKEQGLEAPLFAKSPSELLSSHSASLDLGSGAHADGRLRIMPAGRNDAHYGARLSTLNLGALYAEGTGHPLIEYFKQVLQTTDALDFIFVDSRTGFSDESGICTRDLADTLVTVVGLNRQNREGTASFLSSLRRSGTKPLTVVMSPVPNGEDDAVEAAAQALEFSLTHAWAENRSVEVDARIPYHPALALTEELRLGAGNTPLDEAYDDVLESVVDRLQLGASVLSRRLRKALERQEWTRVQELMPLLAKLHPDTLEKVALAQEVRSLLSADDSQSIEPLLYTWLPADSWVSGDIAVELSRARQRAAKRWYERALAGNNDATMLGNYANFLTEVLGENDAAEAAYNRALTADPSDVHVLTHYALFETESRGNHDAAEVLYEKALGAAPADPTALGNFATFKHLIRQDSSAAVELYERAVGVDEPEAAALVNYALLLMQQGDTARAENLLQRGIEAAPTDPDILGMYASFLVVSKNLEGGRAQYDAAIRLQPKHANNLGNAALPNLLLGDTQRGQQLIERARALPERLPALDLEMCFYEFAFQLREDAFGDMLNLLENDVRSPGWDLSPVVEAASEHGHPHLERVRQAAEVIGGRASLTSLVDLIEGS